MERPSDPVRGVRLSDELVARVDRWATIQKASRSEAIRRLVEMGLSHAPKSGQLSHASRAKASAMAGDVVDQFAEVTAPPEEQQKRKRRLIYGPREFRAVRKDQNHGDVRLPGKAAPAAKAKRL